MPSPSLSPAHALRLAERRHSLGNDFDAILPGHTRFVWEVGSGHGHFLTAYAQAHPNTLCIGVDIVSDRIHRATRKRDQAKLLNLHFIRADARLFLEALPPTVRLSEIFILFPDPWPKLRHRKHRILQAGFLDAIAARAEASCRLFFRTDFTPYFESAASTIQSHKRWHLVEEAWSFEFETVFQKRAQSYHSLVARLRS